MPHKRIDVYEWRTAQVGRTHANIRTIDESKSSLHIQTLQSLLANGSHIQIPHFQRVLLDELAAGFDLVAHQDAEEVVGGAGVVHA